MPHVSLPLHKVVRPPCCYYRLYENEKYGVWLSTNGVVLTQLVRKFNEETLDKKYPKIELQLFIYSGNMFYFTSLGQSDCLG